MFLVKRLDNFQVPSNARTIIALITLHVDKTMSALILVSKGDFIISIHHFTTSNFSECITDSDCPDHLTCGDDEECVGPLCPNCAVNALCETRNHLGICICNPGFFGDPDIESCKGNDHEI